MSSTEDRINFQDELLVEILSRLPHSKYVIQCKCVCKRWSALISDPYIVCRFIACKLTCVKDTTCHLGLPEEKSTSTRADEYDIDTRKTERSFVIVAHSIYRDSWKGLMMHLENPISNLRKFTFSSLPCYVGENANRVTVVGAHNDLLVYRMEATDRYHYYICSIQTREWLSLPSTPFYYGQNASNGFICDNYYSHDDAGKVNVYEAYRFGIVVANCPSQQKAVSNYKIHLFSSSSSRWTTKVLLLPRPCVFINIGRSIAFDGKLHLRVGQGMIGFDPFGEEKGQKGCIRCHVISWPPGFFCGPGCVGVRQGKLQVSGFDDYNLFTIWVLDDYGRGEWSLVHKITTEQWIWRNHYLSCEEGIRLGRMLAQHPSNPDIIYVSPPWSWKMRSILMCDTSTRRVKVACRVPKSMRIDRCLTSYSLMLPIWPTPLPTLV